jgi:hypothetical protein
MENPAPPKRSIYVAKKCLTRFTVCAAHNPKHEHGPVGEGHLATYPMQLVSIDLIGPLTTTTQGSCYALTIIDHCTGLFLPTCKLPFHSPHRDRFWSQSSLTRSIEKTMRGDFYGSNTLAAK